MTRRFQEPGGTNTNDLLSAWWLPLTLLLPPVYALLAPAPVYAFTQWRVRRIPPHRRVFTAAAIGLAHAAVSAAFHALPDQLSQLSRLAANPVPIMLAVLVAAAASQALNAGLIGLAVKTSEPETRWRGALISDAKIELAEVLTGATVALLLGQSLALILVVMYPVLLLQRGMLHAQLSLAARTDPKTGLLNALTWEREATAELAKLQRSRRPAAVMLVDIDHFKQVNDTFGHLAGDEVLRGLAATLRLGLREGKDLLGRFGGEEFAVFLPGVTAPEAQRTAERLRGSAAELAVPVDGIGLAGLYQAKAEGRNQVRSAVRPDRRRKDRAPA